MCIRDSPDLAEKQAAAKAAPVKENVSISPWYVHKITSAVSVHNTTVSKNTSNMAHIPCSQGVVCSAGP